MNKRLAQLEAEFGKAIAVAAEKTGRTGEAEKIPASDIYGIVVHAALLFAATMSRRDMTGPEFQVAAGLVFRGVTERRAAAVSPQDRVGEPK